MSPTLVITIALATTLGDSSTAAPRTAMKTPRRGTAIVNFGIVFTKCNQAKRFAASLRDKTATPKQNMDRWHTEIADFEELLQKHDPRYKEEDLEKAIIDRKRAIEDATTAIRRVLEKESAPEFAELCKEIMETLKEQAELEGFGAVFGYGAPSSAKDLLDRANSNRKVRGMGVGAAPAVAAAVEIVPVYVHRSCDFTDRLIVRLNEADRKPSTSAK